MPNETPFETALNRTGVAMAPMQAQAMREAGENTLPTAPGDGQALARLRASYVANRVAVGSMPPPSSVKGAVRTGVEALKGHHPNLFLDKLGERLAFERTAVRLYDALIAAIEVLGEEPHGPPLAELRAFREDEARHHALLRRTIASLGADPTVVTPCADTGAVAAQGLVQVSTDPRTSRSQRLQALLVAELTDTDGWDLLVALARGMDRDDLAQGFEMAQRQEAHHLSRVRAWLRTAVLSAGNAGRGGVEL
jgi:hypothetical protein